MASFIAVDTGGTFTDLVAFDAVRGEVRYTKSLTTHEDPLCAMLGREGGLKRARTKRGARSFEA